MEHHSIAPRLNADDMVLKTSKESL